MRRKKGTIFCMTFTCFHYFVFLWRSHPPQVLSRDREPAHLSPPLTHKASESKQKSKSETSNRDAFRMPDILGLTPPNTSPLLLMSWTLYAPLTPCDGWTPLLMSHGA